MKKINVFLVGCLFWSSIQGLRQDIMGKEGFIDYVQNNWVSSEITIPIEIAGLLIVIFYLFIKTK